MRRRSSRTPQDVEPLTRLSRQPYFRLRGETVRQSARTVVMSVRTCEVSYRDHRGIRHSCSVDAESLFEAVCLAVTIFRQDPWLERVGPSTVLDIEVRDPGTKHAISIQQVERWLEGATSSPNEAVKKARLKMMLTHGR